MARAIVSLLVLLSIVLCQPPRATAQQVDEAGPDLLTFDELVQLYQQDIPERQLQTKPDRLLTTPFVSNEITASGVEALKPSSPLMASQTTVPSLSIGR